LKRIDNFQQSHASENGESENPQKGILDARRLPDDSFSALWDSIIVATHTKERLLSQAILNFTLRPELGRSKVPLHRRIEPPRRRGT
jgi:hypothetical protein